jgi:hypothetical protein
VGGLRTDLVARGGCDAAMIGVARVRPWGEGVDSGTSEVWIARSR